MCGINGVFGYGKRAPAVDEAELLRVRDAMISRGPDAAGLWISKDRSVGFGHRRLSIIDLSESGNQPMHSACNRYTITFNGEIYNYKELRSDLEQKGRVFRSHSDTEVILTLFDELGTDAFKSLRGMFALAIWDQVEKRLVLARGPMGIKPLYVSDDGHTLRFASQVKALLKSGGVDSTPDPAGHTGFFLCGHVPEPFTLYKGIRQIPAGSFLICDESGMREPFAYSSARDWFKPETRRQPLEDLRDALEDTIRAHFVADLPVSVFLSAGRDSSTLLAMATALKREPIRTVTLAFREYENTPDDESVLAETIGRQYGSVHDSNTLSYPDFEANLPTLIEAMDQPTVDGINTYFVCKAAAELGVKVALSGVGADEIFGGYPSFVQIPKLVRTARWPASVPLLGRSFRALAVKSGLFGRSPKLAGVIEWGGSIEQAYLLRRALFMPWELGTVLDSDVVSEGLARLDLLGRLRSITKSMPNDHTKIVALELQYYMQGRLLRDSDWASMAHSLELRTPFVDVELMRRLGPWIASGHPPTKADMASCPLNRLPDSVLSRPKTGFQVPILQWASRIASHRIAERPDRTWARFVYQQLAGSDLLNQAQLARA